MGFSCSIYQGKKDITSFEYKKNTIHASFLDIAPNCESDTEAPNRVSAFRDVITNHPYSYDSKDSAQDCFRALKALARENLESLQEPKHCSTCECPSENTDPKGWSVEALKFLLSIDSASITKIGGGY